MSEQPPAWPDWAPDDLVRRYQERSTEEDRRLKRLLTDPRMEKVWAAIKKRTENPEYPLTLWCVISVLLSCVNPKKSLNALQKQHSTLSRHLRKVIEHLSGSVLEKNEGLLIEMEKEAHDIEDNLRIRSYFTNPLRRTVEFPQRTALARNLTMMFRRDFKTPLWNPTALLIEVALDLPEGTVTGQWVQNTCNSKAG